MKRLTNINFFIIALFLLLLIACKKENEAPDKGAFTPSMHTTDMENNAGIRYWENGDYPEALKHLTKAYNLAKKNNDTELIATLLNNMGLVNWSMGNNDQAMECYKEAAKFAVNFENKALLGLTHTNQSLILKQEKKFDEAFKHNNIAISIFDASKDTTNLAIVYNNQGQLYRASGKQDPALQYYRLSLEECAKNNNQQGAATAWQNIASAYREKGEVSKALEPAHRALAISQKLKNNNRICEAYLELTETHEKLHHPDSALYYLRKHYELMMQIMDNEQKEELSKNLAKQGLEVKNLRIKNLQKEKEIAKIQLWAILSAIIGLLVIAGFFVYRHFATMKFKRRQLEMELDSSRRILEIKEQELKTYIIGLSKKNAVISSLQEKTPEIEEPVNPTEEEIAALLEKKILTDDDWENFKQRFKAIYPDFFTKISESHVPLTEAENRLLVLMRLELNSKDMANILGISPQSVRVCKMRLKKKLPADKYESVEDFLAELTLNG